MAKCKKHDKVMTRIQPMNGPCVDVCVQCMVEAEHIKKATEPPASSGQSIAHCYVQISRHETKNFWMADYFKDLEADIPEWYQCGKIGEGPSEVMTVASRKYPGVSFVYIDPDMEYNEDNF